MNHSTTRAELDKENKELKEMLKDLRSVCKEFDNKEKELVELNRNLKAENEFLKSKIPVPPHFNIEAKSIHIDILHICHECGIKTPNFMSIQELRKVSRRIKTLFNESEAL
jgi:hypothetical protein